MTLKEVLRDDEEGIFYLNYSDTCGFPTGQSYEAGSGPNCHFFVSG